MKKLVFFVVIFFGIQFSNKIISQTNSIGAPSDAQSGFTYDFDLAKDLILEYQINPNESNTIVKPIYKAKNFPKLKSKEEVTDNYLSKLQEWMEKNHSIIIESLKSRKDIVHSFSK